jgi:hypothetical protein
MHGKTINPVDCNIVFNNTEIGKPDNPDYIMLIERVYNEGNERSFKLLGVYFDEFLNFDHHITHVFSKISKSLYCIDRIKNFVVKNSLKKLYFSMVHSHIAYCINVYGCANQTHLSKLLSKQKQAIRVVCVLNYREHTKPLFKQLNILPVDKLITYYRVKFMHSYMFNKLPISFASTWITNREKNPTTVLRNANDLYIPPHRIEMVKKFPLNSFPHAWNTTQGDKLNIIQHIT